MLDEVKIEEYLTFYYRDRIQVKLGYLSPLYYGKGSLKGVIYSIVR
ncbi:IS3 family transposase [Sporosarcina limicola]